MPTSLKNVSSILCAILYSVTVLAQPGFYLQVTGDRHSHSDITSTWAPLSSSSFDHYTQTNQDHSFTCYVYLDNNRSPRDNDEPLKITEIGFGSEYTKDATGVYKSVDGPTDRIYALALWNSPQSICDKDPDMVVLFQKWSKDGENLHGIVYLNGEGTSALETQLYQFRVPTPYLAFRVITVAERDIADGYYGDLDIWLAQWGKHIVVSKANHGSKLNAGFDEEEEDVMFSTEETDEDINSSPTYGEIIYIEADLKKEEQTNINDGPFWLQRPNERHGPGTLQLPEASLAKIREATLKGYQSMSRGPVIDAKVNRNKKVLEKEKWKTTMTPEQRKQFGSIPGKSLVDQVL